MYYLYLDLFVKNHIFKYPTLKLTHWPLETREKSRSRHSAIFSKIVAEIDYSVKTISKRRTTRLLLFVFSFLTSELTFS